MYRTPCNKGTDVTCNGGSNEMWFHLRNVILRAVLRIGSRSGSDGPVIKLLPETDLFYLYQRCEEILEKKSNILLFLMIYYLFDNIFFHWVHVINWPPGSGPVSEDYGSADPKAIFMDPQH